MYRICHLPGDGISSGVMECAEQVLRSVPIDFECIHAENGFSTCSWPGTPLPDSALEKIHNTSGIERLQEDGRRTITERAITRKGEVKK